VSYNIQLSADTLEIVSSIFSPELEDTRLYLFQTNITMPILAVIFYAILTIGTNSFSTIYWSSTVFTLAFT